MSYAVLFEKLQRLPVDKQAEVFDYVDWLTDRFSQQGQADLTEWSEGDWSHFAMTQAMHGLEDEPVLYTAADLKERWQ